MVDPPPRKKSTATRVVLTIVLGFVLLVLVGIGTCTVVVLQNPAARKTMAAIPAIIKEGVAATAAPGAEELRDAGCDEAGVMDTAALLRLVESIEAQKGEDQRQPVESMPPSVVFCQFSFGTPTLDCEDVVRIYVRALTEPPPEVAVLVRVKLPRRDVCRGIYDREGRLVRALDERAAKMR